MSTITADELDLLTFFECEPKRLDEDIPWPYNDFAYEFRRGGRSISFSVAPAYKDVRIIIKDGQSVVYELNSMGVEDIVYEKHADHEVLLIDVNERDRLVLTLKPEISISHIVSERT